MSVRVPHEAVEQLAPAVSVGSIDLDWLAAVIRDANQPVPIETLVRQAVRASIAGDGQLRAYAAGRRYRRGERVRLLDGRLGDVQEIIADSNERQGAFKILTVRLRNGHGTVRLAAEVEGGPMEAVPQMISEETVSALLAGQEIEVTRRVRQALASDPRFITLYYSDGEYGCLREFFPPMSPDVLDAAMALLLDALFDQVPISRVTSSQRGREAIRPLDRQPSGAVPATVLFEAESLDGALVSNPSWGDEARAGFEKVRSLWRRAQDNRETWSASQMARAFVQPLSRALGWSSVPLPDDAGTRDGIYALCADDVAAAELHMHYGEDLDASPWVLALAQIIRWGQPLDQPNEPEGRAPLANEEAAAGSWVPSHRMVSELRRTGVRWGILTNGRIWRIFSRDTNSLARSFYEVDLGAVFDGLAEQRAPDAEAWGHFRRWWLLFRRASYVAGADGRCTLERLRERSPRGGVQVREVLTERLLTRAVPAIAGGLIAYRRHRLGVLEETAASLAAVYRASVVLASRLLFVLTCEGRELLPLQDPHYYPHSLTQQAQWATDRITKGLPLGTGVYTTPRYDLVLALFHRISRGDGEKQVPCYGHLFFDPGENEDHAFLERVRLSDHAIVLTLDALYQAVDFRHLDSRDLMSICAPLVGGQLLISDVETSEVVIARSGDSAQPPATLPDFVVASSAEQALVPVLQAREARFAAAMDRVVALRRQLQRALDREKRSRLFTEWEAAARDARQSLLGIRVCDPAMGAGGFLVGAVDVLTDGLIERLQAYHATHTDVPRDWNPIYRLVDDARKDIAEEVGRQGIEIEPAVLDDATLLSRLVAQRCVFGVGRDPLATEIARVALWLHTFAAGAPLSFLDHHLRSGNALLGAELDRIDGEEGGARLLAGVAEAAGTLYALTERVDTTPLDVRWSAGQFAKVDEALQPYRLALDLVVSADLGDDDSRAALDESKAALGEGQPAQWFEQLRSVAPAWVVAQAEAEGFLHWQLAFPEVFIDLGSGRWRSDRGFDAVLGNPPWVTTSEEALEGFYTRRFAGTDPPEYNVHQAYLALAGQLLRAREGRTAFVLSREWLASAVGGI